MNLNDISTQLLFTTIPIWVDKGGSQATGTGFVLSLPVGETPDRQIPFLVTNRHVVEGARRGLIDLLEREGDQPKRNGRMRVEVPGDLLVKHFAPNVDLVVIPLGGVLNELEQAGHPAFFRSITKDFVPSREVVDDLSAMEEITFIGYPSGLRDEHNATPLIRKGITSTPAWNDFQGEPAFLIDAGVFPGSSGSPVFILNQGAYATRSGLTVGNRLLFMGALTEAIVRREADLPDVFLGLGKVIKSQLVLSFAEEVAASLPR